MFPQNSVYAIVFKLQVIYSTMRASKWLFTQGMQACNFTVLKLTQKKVNNICKQNNLKAIVFKLQVIYSNSENLKVAIAQLCNELQVCYYTMI